MGVPVVSMAGRCHAHNVGASLLTAVGLAGEWVVADGDAYVARAAAAAADLPRLAALRAGLRGRVLASPLCDAPAFVAGLEAAYRRLFERWLEGGCGAGCACDEGSSGSRKGMPPSSSESDDTGRGSGGGGGGGDSSSGSSRGGGSGEDP
jgi:protein O-GlcNAc transferase